MHALPIPLCTTLLLLLLSFTAYTSAAISFTPKVYCANYPHTVAGTPISKRALPFPPNPHTHPRSSDPIYWCAASSRTYIGLQIAHAIDGPAVLTMLNAASASVTTHIATNGDGEIGGDWNFSEGEGLTLTRMRTYDAGGNHMTWGVLGAALGALANYVGASGGVAGMIQVFDGKNQVGAGFLG